MLTVCIGVEFNCIFFLKLHYLTQCMFSPVFLHVLYYQMAEMDKHENVHGMIAICSTHRRNLQNQRLTGKLNPAERSGLVRKVELYMKRNQLVCVAHLK